MVAQARWTYVIVAVFLMTASTLQAQQRQRFSSQLRPPQRRPTTSPYLNLLNRGGSGGIGFQYFRNVRPEMEFRSNDARFGRELGSLREQVERQGNLLQSRGSGLTPTGHRTFFRNLGSYFGTGPRRQ